MVNDFEAIDGHPCAIPITEQLDSTFWQSPTPRGLRALPETSTDGENTHQVAQVFSWRKLYPSFYLLNSIFLEQYQDKFGSGVKALCRLDTIGTERNFLNH
jgi:hypothetical protein